MKLEALPHALTVCKVKALSDIDLNAGFFFIGRTGEELSLVCETSAVPAVTLERDDGWRAFRVQGPLDFSLVGILAKIAGVLADSGISLFAVSTYNTDYVLVREARFQDALDALARAGYAIKDAKHA